MSCNLGLQLSLRKEMDVVLKVIIGITSDIERDKKHALDNDYLKSVINAGGIPLIVPVGIEEDIGQVSSLLDGILITGGNDVDPLEYSEEPHRHLGELSPERDSMEKMLIKQMLSLGKPIFGICRGQQILNVALGGTLYQDLSLQHKESTLQHLQKSEKNYKSHFVEVKKGSLLESITSNEKIRVNSFHHQAVKHVSELLTISGVAKDGVVEAIESRLHPFVLGVQWHPEGLAVNGDETSVRMFDKFIEACKKRRGKFADN